MTADHFLIFSTITNNHTMTHTMTQKKLLLCAICMLFFGAACDRTPLPEPLEPVPSARQFAWHQMEFYAFVHFNMNTFTNMEWGTGGENPDSFNPTALDCRQWVRICKDAGMKGIILTAKHHDGFCLWPSAYTEHSVKNSPWKEGKGDVVRELSDACREAGLKFGVYLSPWDRNHADYGKPEYVTYFRNQLRELLTQYGELFEVWFDGANGGTGWYGGANERRVIDAKTYYDWENTYQIIRELQPNAVIFSDAADIRWVGNEEGWARTTNWSIIKKDEFNKADRSDLEILRSGQEDGTDWVPAEVDVSIRPGWYYHPREDHMVKPLPKLLDIYYESVGRNGSLLLNLPVDTRGLVHENDEAALLEMASALRADFANDLARMSKATATQVRGNSRIYRAAAVNDGDPETYWATDDTVTRASVTLQWEKPVSFNRLLVQEYIPLGQRVKEFLVEAMVDGQWQIVARETTIGYKRILRLPRTLASQVRLTVTDAKASPLISNIQIFDAPVVLVPPVIIRNKEGKIILSAADSSMVIHFTTDGSEPTTASTTYDSAFYLAGKGTVKALAADLHTGKTSVVAAVTFDIPREKWKLRGALAGHPQGELILDGNPQTACSPDGELPFDFDVDMGETVTLRGFTYLPDQGRWDPGVITHFEFYGSPDGHNWGLPLASGEFGNIVNSPILQEVKFTPAQARYFRLRALPGASGHNRPGAAEIGVITE